MKKIINILSLTLALSAFIVAIAPSIGLFGTKKIAYIRSTDLIYGYLGMKDAQRTYLEKENVWKANIDTLQRSFQEELNKYSIEAPKLTAEEKAEKEKYLEMQKKNVIMYSQSLDKKAKEEDIKVTQAILNQINSFVTEFGKEKGYDVILGTTDAGSLMYGNEGIDITKVVLDAMNHNYLGETQSRK